eukprot:TRINITY_DN5644_c1_g1_i3.p1 TRINITY_DN5644_c1_g1~~TRINITY_DN5644_c1_g1_i3.p1  ORF type:complete len:117 (-),score=13.27 TRINITY_DN5644_c1_g1_i3:103-453(-)
MFLLLRRNTNVSHGTGNGIYGSPDGGCCSFNPLVHYFSTPSTPDHLRPVNNFYICQFKNSGANSAFIGLLVGVSAVLIFGGALFLFFPLVSNCIPFKSTTTRGGKNSRNRLKRVEL